MVVARHDDIIDASHRVNSAVVRELVTQSLCLLTKATDERSAWAMLLPGLHDDHTIGIKINTVATHLAGHREVVDAVVASLGTGGVSPDRIVIWDNLGRLDLLRRLLYGNVNRRSGSYYQGMERAGYAVSRDTAPRVLCTAPMPPGVGYDSDVLASVPSQGLQLPVTRLLTEVCDHVISIPVPKDHRITGITCALKNFYGAVPLWDDLHPGDADRMHRDRGNPQIAELYADPAIGGRVRLHIVDALAAICDGGPWGHPQLHPRSLLLSRDPVAIDSYVLDMIDAARAARGMSSVAPRAAYIETAAKLQLGANDPRSIELIDQDARPVEWPADDPNRSN
jgi:hypothetical protein